MFLVLFFDLKKKKKGRTLFSVYFRQQAGHADSLARSGLVDDLRSIVL